MSMTTLIMVRDVLPYRAGDCCGFDSVTALDLVSRGLARVRDAKPEAAQPEKVVESRPEKAKAKDKPASLDKRMKSYIRKGKD